jgi:two-component system sensor histidine kinase BaeS
MKSLWAKFFILLLSVSLIGLSAAFYLRQMMVTDFRRYLEGQYLDQVYRITAELEGGYEFAGGWDERALAGSAVRALMLGIQIEVQVRRGQVLMDSETALGMLRPLMERRVLSILGGRLDSANGEFTPYPLFLKGERIGILKVRPLAEDRSLIFVRRSNRFLLLSLFFMGGIAVLASLLVSRRLTRPLKKLVDQTRAIRRGDLGARAGTLSNDEIGRLSNAFNEMADDLELQETLRRKLIANVAHELRTPLAAMTAELEAVRDGLLPADVDLVESLHEETRRLSAMLDGIDDLTQAQASSLTLSPRAIDLHEFLKNIEDRFSVKAREQGVTLEILEKQETVYADPDRLSQIIINLLSNAIRVVPEGGKVSLGYGREGEKVYIEVSDTGPGIPEEELPRIFERFYSGPGGGLGLGLTIVKELVDAHGGKIEIESVEGKGTSVRVALPSGP